MMEAFSQKSFNQPKVPICLLSKAQCNYPCLQILSK